MEILKILEGEIRRKYLRTDWTEEYKLRESTLDSLHVYTHLLLQSLREPTCLLLHHHLIAHGIQISGVLI